MLRAQTLLTELKALDVRLSVTDGRLRFSAPKGVLSDSLKARLSEEKEAIIALLEQRAAPGAWEEAPIPAQPRGRGLPLSAAPQQTLQVVVQRHEVLRSAFRIEQDVPAQVPLGAVDVALPVHDLTSLDAAACAAEVKRTIRREALTPFDLQRGEYVNHPSLRIVFAGVNSGIESYGYVGAGNVKGIFERKDLHALKEALLSLRWKRQARGPLRVMHIGDSSRSVADDDHQFREFDWRPLINQPSRLVGHFDQWKEAVLSAQDQTDFIVTTNYRKISRSASDRTRVVPAEVVAWTLANSRVPVIGTNGFFVEDGGELAIGTSPFEQGEVSARMAVRLLAGQAAKNIACVSTRQFVVHMRSTKLRERGMELPPLYEAFARATNSDLP